jgi:hypothetical protein
LWNFKLALTAKPFVCVCHVHISCLPMMSRLIWQRHPRYALSILLILATTFYFLWLDPTSSPSLHPPLSSANHNDHDLPARMERAERIYNKILHDRQSLIRKFGPKPTDVVMCDFFRVHQLSHCVNVHLSTRFPPNKDPWPAYTACMS